MKACVDGKRHYGDGLYQEAEKIPGVPYNDLARFKRVSEQFEISRRQLNLTYSHHIEVASIKQITEVKGKLTLSEKPMVCKLLCLMGLLYRLFL
jgi:hypothetical protein